MKGTERSDDWYSRRADGWSGSWDNWKQNDTWKPNESRGDTAWRGSRDHRERGSNSWKTDGSSKTTGGRGSWEEWRNEERKTNRTSYEVSWPGSCDNRQQSEDWNSSGAREKDAWTAGQTQRSGTGWNKKQFSKAPIAPDKRFYIETNKKIGEAAAAKDPKIFLNLLDNFCKSKIELNHVNVATILHKSAKLRLRLRDHVISFLAEIIRELDETFEMDTQEVGNALYGLQRMGDSEQTRELLAALTPKVRDCREALRAQEVGNALYGLQRMGDSEQTRGLVAALTPKVRECREALGAQHVGNALYGLQRA